MSKLTELVKLRRSIYALGRNINVSDNDILNFIKNAVKHVPSAFNTQTSKVVVLLGEYHDKFWGEIVMNALKKVVPAESFEKTENKINSFKTAYGTLLIYENKATIKQMQEKFPLYAHNFPMWSRESSGMLQYTLWIGLAEMGIGASLQHYNELIEEDTRKFANVSNDYMLIAQMPFGSIEASAGDKEFKDLDARVTVLK
ncbi:MAG: nitroreductase family protein [Christensenellaceae bacterium]|nr:nitroreductase family protein [Christensenellaceae bacterium]